MNKPTKKQRILLDFVQKYSDEYGFSPSYREIMRAMELKSVSAVAEHVDNCVKAGFLKKEPNAARKLEVIPLETHEETTNLFKKKLAELAAQPESDATKDDIATLKAAAKLLNLVI